MEVKSNYFVLETTNNPEYNYFAQGSILVIVKLDGIIHHIKFVFHKYTTLSAITILHQKQNS